MRFVTLLASAVALLGFASAAPAPDAAKVVAMGVRSPEAAAHLEERQSVPAINDAIASSVANPAADRDEWVRDLVTGLGMAYPGHNIFVFHRFKGNFRYRVPDLRLLEGEAKYSGDMPRTEYFKVVVFKSAGTLERTGGDGGWRNWGFRGVYEREGDRIVHFKARA